jgi:hypothetical protein
MEAATVEPSMYTVKAVMILDNDGERILAKYFDDSWPSTKEQKEFEKNLFQKTQRANGGVTSRVCLSARGRFIVAVRVAEIVMFEGVTCVYRSNVDLFFYVIGSSFENEVT